MNEQELLGPAFRELGGNLLAQQEPLRPGAFCNFPHGSFISKSMVPPGDAATAAAEDNS
jgi:hypothetical protein